MHVLLSADDSELFLLEELHLAFPNLQPQPQPIAPGLLQLPLDPPSLLQPPPILAFARQLLPNATFHKANSISAWSQLLFDRLFTDLDESQPWRLSIDPHWAAAEPTAGLNRCRLIRDNLMERLQKKRRHLRRQCQSGTAPWSPTESHVQLLLTDPESGWLSLAKAPLPHQWRHLITPFPKGDIPVAVDKSAPSRAFTKLVETEQRIGFQIRPGETCVDLGASPGSWSYVALQRGATVFSVDRAELRPDLMRNPKLHFTQGDAFKFTPNQTVDWLLCDVIATPQRSVELLKRWVTEKLARRFVVSIKFKGHEDYSILEELKRDLPPLCTEFGLTRLCANKNEACCFGIVKNAAAPSTAENRISASS